ncbi:protein kinase domain-containing protein [Kitasatospora sp. NPDC054795]
MRRRAVQRDGRQRALARADARGAARGDRPVPRRASRPVGPGSGGARLREQRAIRSAEALRALAPAPAVALSGVHRLGLVHRDLEPADIMLTTAGPRLLDFGIAAIVDGTRPTATGGGPGALTYLAPEQFGEEGVGPAAVHDRITRGRQALALQRRRRARTRLPGRRGAVPEHGTGRGRVRRGAAAYDRVRPEAAQPSDATRPATSRAQSSTEAREVSTARS